jgi:hypothetical protein
MASDGKMTPSLPANVSSTRQALRTEIETVIEDFKDSKEKPPFTLSELVVMATICCEADAITLKDVTRWTTITFQFYRQQVIGEYMQTRQHNQTTLRNFLEVFDEWDVPLTCGPGDNTLVCRATYLQQSEKAFTAPTSYANGWSRKEKANSAFLNFHQKFEAQFMR